MPNNTTCKTCDSGCNDTCKTLVAISLIQGHGECTAGCAFVCKAVCSETSCMYQANNPADRKSVV